MCTKSYLRCLSEHCFIVAHACTHLIDTPPFDIVCCSVLALFVCILPVIFSTHPYDPSSLVLSCSNRDAAPRRCGAFLPGHGFLCSLLEMRESDWIGRDWMGTGWGWTLRGHALILVVGHLLDYLTDEALLLCGPMEKTSRYCPHLVTGFTPPPLTMCALQTWGPSWIYSADIKERREPSGLSLGDTVVSTHTAKLFILKDARDGRAVPERCTIPHYFLYLYRT